MRHARSVLALLAALCLWVAAGPSVAATATPVDQTAFETFMRTTTGANSQTVSFGTGGTPILNPSPYSFAPDGGSGVPLRTSGAVPNPAGEPVTMNYQARVPNANLAGALGRFFAKAGSALPIIGNALVVGVAVYDFAKEMGWTPKLNASGVGWDIQQPADPTICTAGACYQYWATTPASFSFAKWDNTADLACKYGMDRYNAANFPYKLLSYNVQPQGTNGDFMCNYQGTMGERDELLHKQSVAPNPNPPMTVLTTQQIVDAITAKAGWAANSRVADAAAQAAVANGEKLKVDPASQSLSGPATSPGQHTTTTSTNADGSTRTDDNVCQYGHTYTGNMVVGQQTCTETVTNDGTANKTTVNTKTDSTPTPTGNATVPVPPKDPCGIPGGSPCKIDESGTPSVDAKVKLDETTIQADQKTTRDATVVRPSVLDNWTQLFVTPPVVACQPLTFTMLGGATQDVNPCPVVDGVRGFMGFLWAIAGFWLCLGWIRESL